MKNEKMKKNSEYGQKGQSSKSKRNVPTPRFQERVVTKSPAQYITKPEKPKRNKSQSETKPQQVRTYPNGLQFINQLVLKELNKVSTSYKVTDEFNLSKHEAIEIEGWKLWKNKLNKLVVVPASVSDDARRYYTFDYEPGVIYFIQPTLPNQVPYVYYRGTKFREFLEKYQINKVIRKDPNGLFAGKMKRSSDGLYWEDEFAVFTDGNTDYSANKDLSLCNHTTINNIAIDQIKCIEVRDTVSVSILTQSSTDEHGKVSIYRTLITQENIYNIEDQIIVLSNKISAYF